MKSFSKDLYIGITWKQWKHGMKRKTARANNHTCGNNAEQKSKSEIFAGCNAVDIFFRICHLINVHFFQ